MSDLATLNVGEIEAAALANVARYVEQARGALAPNTERAIKADTGIFATWCGARDLPSLPAAAETIAAFVDAMTETKAPATVRRYVASIVHHHQAAEIEPNPAGSNAVKNALKRMHRAKGRAQVQAIALDRKMVDRLLEDIGTSARALRNRALVAVAYDSLCRRSELAAFNVPDLQIGPEGDGTLTIRRSKTDQEGVGMVRYLAADTVREVQAWLKASGVNSGPLFRSVNRHGAIGGAIDAGDVARVFKEMAVAARIPAEKISRISGHSSRVGAAQDMVTHNITLPAVMQAGGWKSVEMVSRYTAHATARQSGAAQLAAKQGRG